MAEKILIDDFQKEKAIELSGGTILDLPQRTAEIYEELVGIEKSRASLSEYEYCKKVLELLFGKDGFKKIAPEGKKTNLDYLEKVQLTAVNLFMSDKHKAEREQFEKQAEMLEPITDRLTALHPIMNKLK